MRPIPDIIKNNLKNRNLLRNSSHTGFVTFVDKPLGNNILQFYQCSIDREEAAIAQRCVFKIWNVNPNNPRDLGFYSPDRGDDNSNIKNDWYQQIMPGKNVTVHMGYGSNYVQVFKGTIDDVTINETPGESSIEIDCRDDGWRLLDAYIQGDEVDEDGNNYYLYYADMDTSDIAKDLFIRAGFPESDISTKKSGIILPEKEFQNCTWADAITELMTISAFELRIDEYGKIKFLYPTNMEPKISNEFHSFENDLLQLNSRPIVSNTEKILDLNNNRYTKDIDYSIDYKSGMIKRLSGGVIPSNGVINAEYVYAAYVFEAGKDLYYLPYTISRRKQYGKIIAVGDGVQASYTLPNPETRGVLPNRVLFINNECIDTTEKCQSTADRLGKDMSRRFREIEFASIAVPWVQVGDCVQIIEPGSTISEIYRIVSQHFEQTQQNYTMTASAYYYGYTPL